MYNFIFTFISILLVHSPIFGITFVNNEYVPADYVVRADKITAEVKDKLRKRYNMSVVGITGGMIDCVNVLGLSFQIRGPLVKDVLRRMLIDCVEEFLTPINADEKLRPFLKNYPFTAKEIVISIFVDDKNGLELYDPEISVASAINGKLIFRTVDIDNPWGYKQCMEESYENARKKVQEEKKLESICQAKASDFFIKRLIPSSLCQKYLLRNQFFESKNYVCDLN